VVDKSVFHLYMNTLATVYFGHWILFYLFQMQRLILYTVVSHTDICRSVNTVISAKRKTFVLFLCTCHMEESLWLYYRNTIVLSTLIILYRSVKSSRLLFPWECCIDVGYVLRQKDHWFLHILLLSEIKR
jgi:hypothetical protein